jgi:SAM-dependent methyltransferase
MSEGPRSPLNPGGALVPFFGRFESTHRVRYEFATRYVRLGDCLDFGCGYGIGTDLMSRSTSKSVVGVDIDQRCIAYARSHFVRPNLSYELVKEVTLPVADRSLGLLVCFEVVEHLYPEQISTLLREARRTLREGGILLGSTPNSRGRAHSLAPYHIHEFSPEELSALARSAGFDIRMLGQVLPEHQPESLFSVAIDAMPVRVKRSYPAKILQSLYFAMTTDPAPPHRPDVRIQEGDIHDENTVIFVMQPRKIAPSEP